MSAFAAVAAASAVGLTGLPAQASATTFRDHQTISVAGDVFSCLNGDLTVTDGTISQAIEGVQDGQGIFHITGTIVPHDVTLTDVAGNTYTISGATWFGGKYGAAETDVIVETETDHFVIHGANGGVYAKVQAVEHLSPNGKVVSFDLGSCQPPED